MIQTGAAMGCSSMDPLLSSSLAVSQTLPSQHMCNLLSARSLLPGSSTSNSLTGFKFNIKRKTLSKRFSSHDIQTWVVNLSKRKMGHFESFKMNRRQYADECFLNTPHRKAEKAGKHSQQHICELYTLLRAKGLAHLCSKLLLVFKKHLSSPPLSLPFSLH